MERTPKPAITQLKAAGLVAATVSGSDNLNNLGRYKALLITLDITVAERDSANETYDVYVTTGDGVGKWDIVHFPQIATTGAKRFTARIVRDLLPQNVTTATPGVAANDEAIIQNDTAAAQQGIKTLAAGKVRHGPWGDRIGYEVVIAGTVATGINFSLTAMGVG